MREGVGRKGKSYIEEKIEKIKKSKIWELVIKNRRDSNIK